jgi:rhamnosyltransferase
MNNTQNVAVLMATYNGVEWIDKQIESILNQSAVNVILFISDDCSSDGTLEYVQKLSQLDKRIIILPKKQRIGSAGKNFYRLILDVDFSSFDYIAFADQDDIWNLDKLFMHIELFKKYNAEAISSNVLAFWPDGQKKLIVKSRSQKNYDFLFESAGPGCTFLLSSSLANQVKHYLINNEFACHVSMHDWLIYAICRAYRKKWIIDSIPSVYYRQHQNNVIGANAGLKALISRLQRINNGWYREEVTLISKVVSTINYDTNFQRFQKIIQLKSSLDRFRLLPFVLQGRRKLIDRCALLLSILFFIF